SLYSAAEREHSPDFVVWASHQTVSFFLLRTIHCEVPTKLWVDSLSCFAVVGNVLHQTRSIKRLHDVAVNLSAIRKDRTARAAVFDFVFTSRQNRVPCCLRFRCELTAAVLVT